MFGFNLKNFTKFWGYRSMGLPVPKEQPQPIATYDYAAILIDSRERLAVQCEKEATIQHACVIASGIACASVKAFGDIGDPSKSGFALDAEMIAASSVAIVLAIEAKVL